MKPDTPNTCSCESGRAYDICCKPFHNGTAAPTAEALMRSRYTAYVHKLDDYLLATWHASTRPAELDLSQDAIKWLGLSVKHTETTGDTATVEFVARYRIGGGRAEKMHEISRFVRENGAWFYVDGKIE
jgi:SEC-C motif domain protein